jgi:hypothetical protein
MGLPVKRPKNNLVVIDPKDVQVLKPLPSVADDIDKMISNWWDKKKIKSDSSVLETKIYNGELRLKMADLVISKKEKEWMLSIFMETKAMELEKNRVAHKTFIVLEEEKRVIAEFKMNCLRRLEAITEIEAERRIAEERMLLAKANARAKEFEDE